MAASANYLNPVDLVRYYDSRRVLQLASDSGATAVIADLSSSASAAYGFVLNALRSAAADLDSHCQQGRRYLRADLEAIIADAVTYPTNEIKNKRAALIQQLVADLTFGIMCSRRGQVADALKALCPRYETALVTLDRLAEGVQIFDTDTAIARGVPARVTIGKNIYRPSRDNRLFGVWNDDTTNRGYC